jgi:hypothetical protein
MPPVTHSPAEVLAAFVAFEEQEHLFDRELLGVAYWQLIRHDVFRATLQALGLAERAHLRLEELPLSHWLGAQLSQLPKTLWRSQLAGLPRADLLVATHPRHQRYHDKYICPYSQPLLWGTERSRVLLTGHFQGRYFGDDAGEETRYVDLGLVISHALFRAREWAGRGLPPSAAVEIAGLTERMAAQLGAAPPKAEILRRVRTAVLASVGLKPWFERLLGRVQPRLIVNVVGYRLVHQLLTLGAREHGIPVAELQHGTIGASHPGYTFAPGRRPAAFPDHLLLFGDIWRELTPGLPLPAAQMPAIGYGWLELQRGSHPRRPGSGKRRVLFISQRGIGRELAAIAMETAAQLPAAEFEIVFRLHPSEAPGWQANYATLTGAGVRVEEPAARGLYAAQAEADVQVGVYSTALLEGLAFGLDTCVVTLPGHEQLAFLYERSLAQRAASADELADILRAPPQPSERASEALWAPNPRERFKHFVEAMLHGDAAQA